MYYNSDYGPCFGKEGDTITVQNNAHRGHSFTNLDYGEFCDADGYDDVEMEYFTQEEELIAEEIEVYGIQAHKTR